MLYGYDPANTHEHWCPICEDTFECVHCYADYLSVCSTCLDRGWSEVDNEAEVEAEDYEAFYDAR